MSKLYGGLHMLYGVIDWMFMVLFMGISWLAITIFKTERITKKATLKIRNRWIVVGVIVVLSIFWIWYKGIGEKDSIFSMLVTVIAAMVFNEMIGVNVIFDSIYDKVQSFLKKKK